IMVLLLRAAMDAQLIKGGILSGLADARQAGAITAMHERPENSWSLEDLARIAGMSRARFATHFRQVVGVTPLITSPHGASVSRRRCSKKGSRSKWLLQVWATQVPQH